MNGERDEALGRLGEELAAALAAGEAIALPAWAQRFAVDEADVAACLRALRALDAGLGEEVAEGWPELPAPRLPDDYELVGEVGRGGMGVVYRAHQRSLGRDVAIKVLRPGDLVFGEAMRRFRGEARSLARLRHRHIVSVHDLGESQDGTLWFAMDLIDGGTLAEELARSRRFAPSRAVRTLRQVAAAVVHAHSHGIVHRDLKPQNVLLDGAGDAFVADFGLARDVAAGGLRTLTGELLGTPAYMSPEQAAGRGDAVGEASDVWALGAILYELLTGRGPFAGKPLHETIRAILEDEPMAPRRLDARIPAALEAICLKALRKRPADRYPTALAFAEDLERFADGREVLARPPSRLSRVWRLVRRRGASAAVAAIAVVATLGIASMWLPSLQRQALLAAAERLGAEGHPHAAIAALQDLQARYQLPADEHARAGVALARAHNDVAAERLFAGDRSAAVEAARQALAVAAQHHRDGALWLLDEVADFAPWQWQLARARVLVPPPPLPPGHQLRWPVLVPLVLDDLRSGRPAHVVLAGMALSQAGLAFSWLNDAERAAWCEPLVVATANLLAAGDALVAKQWPLQWQGSDHDTWWSPALEIRLAELATQSERPALQRAVAAQVLCQLVGLPTAAVPDASLAAEAPALVAAWRHWQGLPMQERLRARIDWLVSSGRVLPTLRSWLGSAVPDADAAAWWARQRELPFAELLRRALQLPADASLDLVALLDRSATAPADEAMLWRQWAWLQLPGTAAVPMADAALTVGGSQWRQQVLAAAGIEERGRHVVRAAVLRFDDGSPAPQLVAQAAVTACIGEPVRLPLSALLADTPILSVREDFLEDEMRHGEALWPMFRPEREELRLSPRFGECASELRGRLLVDRDGLRLEAGGSLDVGLPGRFGMERLAAARMIWLGGAASWEGLTLVWERGRRISTFVCLAHVGVAADTEPWSLGEWRQAVVQSLQAAAAAPAGAMRRQCADWATPSWWPLPESAVALEELQATGLAQAVGTDRAAALAMAGVVAARTLPSQALVPRLHVVRQVRIALGSPSPVIREAELAALVELRGRVWTPALAANLQRGAAAVGFALPGPLLQEVAEQLHWVASLRALWGSDWRSLLLMFLGLLLVLLAWPPAKHRAAAMGWCAVWLVWIGLGLRVQVDGVVWTPAFVAWSLAIPIAVRGAPAGWRQWHWHRWVGLGLLVWAVVASALAWFGLAKVPFESVGMAVVGIWLLVRTDESSLWAAWRASREAARRPLRRRLPGPRAGGR